MTLLFLPEPLCASETTSLECHAKFAEIEKLERKFLGQVQDQGQD